MISLDDLVGIPEDKRKDIIRCLDNLLTYRDDEDRLFPIITGYNWYNTLTESDRIIALLHMHETEAYKQDMIKDLMFLGYIKSNIIKNIRNRGTKFRWRLYFNFRDNKGNLLKRLNVKDISTNKYVDLRRYKRPFNTYPEFSKKKDCLFGEVYGWELNQPFKDKQELINLTNLFLRKSGEYIFDKDGNIIFETGKEKELRSPWKDADKIPVLILGRSALEYEDELHGFVRATRIFLIEENNEISFVINKNLKILRKLKFYKELKDFGFREEICLGNKPFICYIDNKRKL